MLPFLECGLPKIHEGVVVRVVDILVSARISWLVRGGVPLAGINPSSLYPIRVSRHFSVSTVGSLNLSLIPLGPCRRRGMSTARGAADRSTKDNKDG